MSPAALGRDSERGGSRFSTYLREERSGQSAPASGYRRPISAGGPDCPGAGGRAAAASCSGAAGTLRAPAAAPGYKGMARIPGRTAGQSAAAGQEAGGGSRVAPGPGTTFRRGRGAGACAPRGPGERADAEPPPPGRAARGRCSLGASRAACGPTRRPGPIAFPAGSGSRARPPGALVPSADREPCLAPGLACAAPRSASRSRSPAPAAGGAPGEALEERRAQTLLPPAVLSAGQSILYLINAIHLMRPFLPACWFQYTAHRTLGSQKGNNVNSR